MSSRSRFLLARFSGFVAAGVLMTTALQATENPKTGPGGCSGCDCPGSGGSGGGYQSFYWYFGIGETSYNKLDMLGLARKPATEGYYLGQNPRSFSSFFEASYTQNLTTNLAPLNLTIEKVDLDESVLLPSSLDMKRAIDAEVIERDGAIRQVLTYNTLADVVPLAVGFHVKVFDRNTIGAKDSSGLYTVPGTSVPINEWIMRTPDGGAFTDTVEVVVIDRKNTGGIRVEVTRFSRDMTVETRTKATYAGSLDESGNVVVGGLLETDAVTYSNRGAKPYDYTLVREVSRITTTAAGPQYGTLKLVSRRLEEYRDFTLAPEGGESSYKRLVREVDGYNTPEARETRYTWYEEPLNPMVHGRLKTKTSSDGNWEYYEYTDFQGAAVYQQVKYSAWRDASFGSAADGSQADLANARKEILSIAGPTDYSKTVSYAGVVTSRESFMNRPQADGSTLCTLTHKTGNDVVLSNRVWSLHSTNAATYKAGRIAWMENPDGTAETYTYTDLTGGSFRLVHRKGAGDRNGVTAGTETTTDYNSFIQASAQSTKDITSGLVLNFWTAPTVDILGRPTRIEYNGNSDDYETFQYSCCGLAHKRERDGSITTYTRDPLKRVYIQSSYRFEGDTNPIITTTAFDGLTTTVTRGGILARATTKLLNGEIVSELSPDQNNDGNSEETTYVTTYSAGGGKTITTTHPDGGTEIRTAYIDGQPKSVTGTAVPDVSYTYGTHTLDGNGLFTQVAKLTVTGGTDEWEKTYRDALDRPVRVEYPSDLDGNGSLDCVSYTYYEGSSETIPTRGRRTKLRYLDDADGKRATYAYDSEGNQYSLTEQMPAGQSRVTLTTYDVVNDSDLGVCRRTTTTVNGVTTNVSLRSGEGYASRSTSLGRTTTTVKTPSTAAGNSTVTTTLPDSTKQVRTTTGNLLTKTAKLDTVGNEIESTSYGYDALRRVVATTDSRTGTTTVNSYTAAGQPLTATDPGNRVTTYTYDKMGRRLSVDAPDTTDANSNTLANITRTSYYPTGQVKAVWGDQTNATFHLYDEQNRLAELRTYRTLAHGTEPTVATTGADATTWTYHPQRGFLTRKQYADQKGTDYTYSPAGQLKTRTWARTVNDTPLVTTYTYDKGLLTGTDYSDSTPDVTITYDAFGRQDTVTQTNQSLIAYTYDPATLALDTETISYDLDHDGTSDFTRVLDRKALDFGRDKGWELKNGATIENQVTYGYHATEGRLDTVSGGGFQPPSQFNYSYEPNSLNLIASVTGPAHTVSNTWETDRDALSLKQNKVGETVISSYDYTVNALGQRTDVSQAGTAFAAARGIVWGYDSLGQVVKADHDADNTLDRAYQYDAIGNRIEARDGVTAVTGTPNYTASELNQYTVAAGITLPTTPAPAPYDLDGNLRFDGGINKDNEAREYVWDAENRLVAVKRVSDSVTLATYLYDAQSRRISKIIGGNTTLFVYDGWNCIAEWSADLQSASLTKTYLWGTDLSGTMQGAGGVGGLLAVSSPITTNPIIFNSFFPTFDGNGNVSEYLDEIGAFAAHFEYDPFGNTVVNSDAAGMFPYRFSTKPQDAETGLLYYGYRYFDPVTGRWPSRDPYYSITERPGNAKSMLKVDSVSSQFDKTRAEDSRGGQVYFEDGLISFQKKDDEYNLYLFVLNGSINSHDVVGLGICCKCIRPAGGFSAPMAACGPSNVGAVIWGVKSTHPCTAKRFVPAMICRGSTCEWTHNEECTRYVIPAGPRKGTVLYRWTVRTPHISRDCN